MSRRGGGNAGVRTIAPGRLKKVMQSSRNNIRQLQDGNLVVEKGQKKDLSLLRRTTKSTVANRQQSGHLSTHGGIESDETIVARNLNRQRSGHLSTHGGIESDETIVARNLNRQRSACRSDSNIESTPNLDDIHVEQSENGAPIPQQDDVQNHCQSEECIPSMGECQLPKRKKLSQVASRISMALQINEAVIPARREPAQNQYEEVHQVGTNVEDETNLESQDEAGNEAAKKKRKIGQRGKYRSLVLDMKIKGKGSKLNIDIPDDIDRAIGDNARHLVNECGRLVRTKAPLNVQDWQEALPVAGDSMWKEIQDKFQIVESDKQPKMYIFVVDTMQRIYRLWKSRLHSSYYKSKKCGTTDEERLKNPPPDIPKDQWEFCVKRFGSAEFKLISERNSTNRLSRKRSEHTTGNLAFAEVEDILTKGNNNVKPTADVIWLVEHTRKNDKGELEWADEECSKDIHDKLKNMVATVGDTMTQEEILLQVLGPRSGHPRGKGTALRSCSKGKHQIEQRKLIEKQQEKMQEQEQRIKMLQESQRELEESQQRQKQELEEYKAQQQAVMEAFKKELLKELATNRGA